MSSVWPMIPGFVFNLSTVLGCRDQRTASLLAALWERKASSTAAKTVFAALVDLCSVRPITGLILDS
tara:strand:- start:651 stop:851 length:201 start_codon:yes stop_codon:yes gene_type:complete